VRSEDQTPKGFSKSFNLPLTISITLVDDDADLSTKLNALERSGHWKEKANVVDMKTDVVRNKFKAVVCFILGIGIVHVYIINLSLQRAVRISVSSNAS